MNVKRYDNMTLRQLFWFGLAMWWFEGMTRALRRCGPCPQQAFWIFRLRRIIEEFDRMYPQS